MKLLLCSDFKNVGYRYLKKFFDLSKTHTCLFIDYANEDFEGDADYTSSSMEKIRENNFNIVALTQNFNFNQKIDMIFVRGGNTTKLVHLLHKFGQFEKIKSLVLNESVLFVGESAGAVLAGSDTEWTLDSEPYDIDVKNEFGKNVLLGFDFVKSLVFVHCSKYRFPYGSEFEDKRVVRLPNTLYYRFYLADRKKYKNEKFITIGNNQVYFQNDGEPKIMTFDWSKIPIQK